MVWQGPDDTLLNGGSKHMTWRSEVFCSRIIHFLAQDVSVEELNCTVILFHVFIILILARNQRPLKYLLFSSTCFFWMWYFSWVSSYIKHLKRHLLYIFLQVVQLFLTNVNFFFSWLWILWLLNFFGFYIIFVCKMISWSRKSRRHLYI